MSDQSPDKRAASLSHPPAHGGSSTGAGACPPAGLLAAYVDGTLCDAEHHEIQAHLVECGDCLEVVAEASVGRAEFGDGAAAENPTQRLAAGQDSARVVSIRGRRRWFWPTVGVLAAAALVVMAVVVPRWSGPRGAASDRPELAELVAAVGEHRPFEPRLTGGFKYGPLAPVMRAGEPSKDVSAEIRIACLRAQQAYEQRQTPDAAAWLASARLVGGQVDEAVTLLARATRERPGAAAWWNDLAAAYLVSHARTGDAASARRALHAADRALSLVPGLREALFNRALALDTTGPAEDASRAWQQVRSAEAGGLWEQSVPRARR